MTDLIELAEAVLADHPFDAGKAMTEAMRHSPLNDTHPVFDWAKTNVRPTERNVERARIEGTSPFGLPPWLVPEGRAWNNVRGRRHQRDGWKP